MTLIIRFFNWFWWLGAPASPLPVLALSTLVMLHVQLLRSIHDVDIFWQLLFGELTLKGGLPTHEPLLAHQQHQPLAAFYWLGQVLYALVFRLGDWPLLRLVDAVVWLGGFFVVARHCSRRLGNSWPAVAALWLGWFAALPFASLRLQSFGVLCFGLLIALVRSQRTWRIKLLVGGGLLLVWQNLHPSVIVAVVYLGCRSAAALGLWRMSRSPSHLRCGAKRDFFTFAAMLFLAIIAIVMTPVGFHIFRLSAYNGEISKHLGITEWQPMWACDWFNNGRDSAWIGIYLSMLVILITIFIAPRALKMPDLVPLFAFMVMSVYCHRFILLWGVVVIPVVAECLNSWFRFVGRARPAVPVENVCDTRRAEPALPRDRRLIRQAVTLVAAVAAIAVPLYREPAPFAEYYPFEAVKALKVRPFRGIIFNDYFWGGVISFHGYPDWIPTHDGRYYVFPKEHWDCYFDEIAKGIVPLSDLDREFGHDAFILRKGTYDGLIVLIRSSPHWTVLFEDWQSIVFVRRGV